MKLKLFASVILASLVFASCDDNTNEVGTSLIDNVDKLTISTDTFTVTTRSIAVDSVLARNTTGYLGKMRDPETGAYITSHFMTQFNALEDPVEGSLFPSSDSIISKVDGKVIADSCELRLYFDDFQGDSLQNMKVTAYELGKPVEDGSYYSNFDPQEKGYIRTGGIKKSKVYTLTDYSVRDSIRWSSSYTKSIKIPLNEKYTDKDGNEYKNFGTYIFQNYYTHPEYFKNSYNFIHNVVPGFYFKSTGGLGSMAKIFSSQLNLWYRYTSNDTTYITYTQFAGTGEVMQTTKTENDNSTIQKMVNDNSCTYLKTPAGIFTEMTLPVEDIMNGHTTDSINSAQVVLQRINNTSNSEYTLGVPSTLLMIPLSKIKSFFSEGKIADYKTSFIATKSGNTYTFHNIGSLVKSMYEDKKNGTTTDDNWNKVVIIPITTSYITVSSSSVLSGVYHDMSLTSTKLVGGDTKLKISVIYSRFK